MLWTSLQACVSWPRKLIYTELHIVTRFHALQTLPGCYVKLCLFMEIHVACMLSWCLYLFAASVIVYKRGTFKEIWCKAFACVTQSYPVIVSIVTNVVFGMVYINFVKSTFISLGEKHMPGVADTIMTDRYVVGLICFALCCMPTILTSSVKTIDWSLYCCGYDHICCRTHALLGQFVIDYGFDQNAEMKWESSDASLSDALIR